MKWWVLTWATLGILVVTIYVATRSVAIFGDPYDLTAADSDESIEIFIATSVLLIVVFGMILTGIVVMYRRRKRE